MAKEKTPSETRVESTRHKDKRTNIPTEEPRDFIADDEAAPKAVLYPHDPLLGTQFVLNLKNTGAGNLFIVFGEPDVDVPTKNGKVTVEIKGLDACDPTSGQIRNSSTDDIACWFVDTDCNGESFFVRRAYFTGAAEPNEKLKRALKVRSTRRRGLPSQNDKPPVPGAGEREDSGEGDQRVAQSLQGVICTIF